MSIKYRLRRIEAEVINPRQDKIYFITSEEELQNLPPCGEDESRIVIVFELENGEEPQRSRI